MQSSYRLHVPLISEPAPFRPALSGRRILLITREPILHQMGGSTTYALGLVELLARNGAEVTLLTTTARSCSPRLWFRARANLPEGVRFAVPGMMRLGNVYLQPLSARAWARFLVRLAVRLPWITPVARWIRSRFREGLVSDAWDLTVPGAAEQQLARKHIVQTGAQTVIVNYAFWGPMLQSTELAGRQRVILMHDLLSARVARFQASGLPLDCVPIAHAEEMAWLNQADCLLAAQEREAELIRPQVRARVLVTPLFFPERRIHGLPESGRCLFVGSNITPNRTGLAWFLSDVWPRVQAACPHAQLAVVGTVCSTLQSPLPGVLPQGAVPSLLEEYARAAVCVVPLLVGSGIKIKLLEALSYGKATVSTSTGVQGLEEWASEAIAVSDDPETFAAAVVRLLTDDAVRVRAEQAATALVQQHFSVQASLPQDFVEGILGAAAAV